MPSGVSVAADGDVFAVTGNGASSTTYDEGDSFDQSKAKGFVYVHGLSSKIAARRDLTADQT